MVFHKNSSMKQGYRVGGVGRKTSQQFFTQEERIFERAASESARKSGNKGARL